MPLAAGSATTGSTVHENLRLATKWLAVNFLPDGVVTQPNRSTATAATCYLERGQVQLPAWSQITHQDQVEGWSPPEWWAFGRGSARMS